LKIVWHDGLGFSLYTKRLDRGRFIWPAPKDGVVAVSAARVAGQFRDAVGRHPDLRGVALG
jgi:transposase